MTEKLIVDQVKNIRKRIMKGSPRVALETIEEIRTFAQAVNSDVDPFNLKFSFPEYKDFLKGSTLKELIQELTKEFVRVARISEITGKCFTHQEAFRIAKTLEALSVDVNQVVNKKVKFFLLYNDAAELSLEERLSFVKLLD